MSLHQAVRVGGLTVHPGDLLHADANGVVNIPLEIASEVAEAAGEFVKAEAITLDYLSGSRVTAEGFKEARGAMMAAIAALSRRVRGASAVRSKSLRDLGDRSQETGDRSASAGVGRSGN